MPDKPFVINDRRKFTAEGELRPDVAPEPAREEPTAEAPATASPAAPGEAGRGPQLVSDHGQSHQTIEFPGQGDSTASELGRDESTQGFAEEQLPPAPTAEQSDQANRAYAATVDRLDTAVRAMDPGGQHAPAMTFERLVQSLYMQTLIQLGGAPEPGQPVHVDLMGARSTIDMLGILAEKTKGNLGEGEDKLLQSALFELRLGFLDVTQALAKQAAQRQPGGPGGPGMPPVPGGGPSIVR